MTSAQFMQALALDLGVSLDVLRRARAHIERAVEVCGEVAHHESLVIRATNGHDILFDNSHLRETIRALVREHEHSEDLTLRRFRELLATQLGVEIQVLEPMSQVISALILLERQRWVDFWWREYLFDPLIPTNEFKCMGTTWQSDLTKPVFKQKTAYEISACLVGSEMCIRDRCGLWHDAVHPVRRRGQARVLA